ncbi:hypothetical protein RintRC_2117 [Richelia intracellularis]|nr:hypothetical protein RintRC_2117 [Richelia intracellularis]
MPKMHSTQPNYLRVSCHFINLHANQEYPAGSKLLFSRASVLIAT